MKKIAQDKEVLVLLALLSVPGVREKAGLAARGGLSQREIADWVGVNDRTVARWEQDALAKFKAALRRQGILEEFESIFNQTNK